MGDKIVLITGASSGIGLGTAIHLAELGAQVVMVCRDPVRGKFMRNEVSKFASDRPPILLLADLSSQGEILRLVSNVRDYVSRIDVLMNNVGAIFARREMTCDNIERTFALNHLAPFLLTHLLMDLLIAAPGARIVNVASEFHSGSLDFSNLQGERRYGFVTAYRRSKLCNILFTYELARRVPNSRITANCLSPNPTATRLGDNLTGYPSLVPFILKRVPLLLDFPEQGARTPVYVAASPDLGSVSGRFFLNCREKRTKRITYDSQVAARLWHLSEGLCQIN